MRKIIKVIPLKLFYYQTFLINTIETKSESTWWTKLITVAKLRQEMFEREELSTFINNEKNDFVLNCYGNKFGDVDSI